MRDPLSDYREKRDFRATPEPAPQPVRARDSRVFVIHRHEARNLHYDLRLEHEGVLRSWAVPKGFSYDPADKRLAVRTEDHPIEYEHFHGRIPKGQYGAGTMTIWDRGHYELVKIPDWEEAIERGEIKLQLYGRRLRGEWHLVRTTQSKNSWLLFKSRDLYSGPSRDSALGIELEQAAAAPLPKDLVPMQCGATRSVFTDPNWLFEMEFAGLRCFAEKAGPRAFFRGVDSAPTVLREALALLRCEQAVLDGVLVALDDQARPDREVLARALAAGDGARITYYAFDLLQWEDYDLRGLSLFDRKAALRTLVPESARLFYADHIAGSGPALLAAIAEAGFPGAIGKRGASTYQNGASPDWQRIPIGGHADVHEPAVAPQTARTAPLRVKATNLAKVYWPAEGHTKGDLLAYYQSISEVMLPYLRDRPVHLNRFPDGIDGKSFYQREAKDGTPDWVRTVPIEHDGAPVPHYVIDDLEMLLHAINLGSIDLHPWLSRVGSLDSPDWAVLDLDPKAAPFADVLRIARAAGRLLRGIGLRPLLKTSGKSGLHVFVPLQPGYSYDHARMFTEAVARVLVRELPDIATVERLPDQRDGKVYLDFLQNRRSQTIVPPYSVRPVRGASVSTPLQWDELEDSELSPRQFTIHTVPERTRQVGDLFRKALDDRQDLLPAIAALEEVLRGK
ncbi:MAG: non-homologous end-joining DNA ligase [Planctomycetes bacterium]|nr:non-homologous end-joining DNA ligase [Planctomycetota bacterium]